jgi:hypothetical protein
VAGQGRCTSSRYPHGVRCLNGQRARRQSHSLSVVQYSPCAPNVGPPATVGLHTALPGVPAAEEPQA